MDSAERVIRSGLNLLPADKGSTDCFYSATPSATNLKRTADQYAQAAYALYADLIVPVADWLTAHVVIIPDGHLAYIPFDALLTAVPDDGTRFHALPYWCLDKQVHYAYSAALNRQMIQKNHLTLTKGAVLAAAPFSYDDKSSKAGQYAGQAAGWPSLPASRGEAAQVAGLWNGLALYGTRCSKARFLEAAGYYRIMHICTHAATGDADSRQSWIAFPDPDTIQYGVAEGNYTRLYLTDGRTHLASLKIKDVVAVLAVWPAFVRIHHSHFINVRHLQHIDTQDGWIAFMVGDTALPVSNARKKGLMAVFYRLYGRINP